MILDWILNNLLTLIFIGVFIYYLPKIYKIIKKWTEGFKE